MIGLLTCVQFASKQMARQSKKCEKAEKTEKTKLKNVIIYIIIRLLPLPDATVLTECLRLLRRVTWKERVFMPRTPYDRRHKLSIS